MEDPKKQPQPNRSGNGAPGNGNKGRTFVLYALIACVFIAIISTQFWGVGAQQQQEVDSITTSQFVTAVSEERQAMAPNMLRARSSQLTAQANRLPWSYGQNMFNVGMSRGSSSVNSYTVNVMSGGPANDVEDWQAIWSFPDDPSEW